MKKIYPHQYGEQPKTTGWTPQHQEHVQNERAWRPFMAPSDRHDYRADYSEKWRVAMDKIRPRALLTSLLDLLDRGAHPLPGRVWARRYSPSEQNKSGLGIVVPEGWDKWKSVQEGALYEVLAVGRDVPDEIAVGSIVVCQAIIGQKVTDDDVFELWALTPPGYEGESDTARCTGGHIHAVYEP